MSLDIPTLSSVAAVTSAIVALALAFGARDDVAANLGPSVRTWAAGIAIQASGWLLIALRGSLPDLLTFVASNTAIALGFAECARAIRAFAARPPRLATYLPVLGVLGFSIAFTFVAPDRHARMMTNSFLLALLFTICCIEVLRISPGHRERPRSHWLVASTFAFCAAILALRVARMALAGTTPGAAVPMSLVVFYASASFGPVVASLGFAMMCNDRLDEELRHLATIDPLTGALNRRSLAGRARHEMAEAARHKHPISLLLIDLDHFKGINDGFGHAAGDDVLRAVTSAVRAGLRETDALSRQGGEEFAVLLPHADRESAAAGAERLRRAIEQLRLPAPLQEQSVTVSIGVAQWAEGETLDELLRRADAALYRAKNAGRNRVDPAPAGAPTTAAHR